MRSLGRAIEYEAKRQIEIIESGQKIEQQTRHWDEAEGRTHKLRSKEEAFDYRYFPEPDLVPIEPSEEWVKEIADSLPPLPRDRRYLLAETIGVEPTETSLIVQRDLDGFALKAISFKANKKPAESESALISASNRLSAFFLFRIFLDLRK